MGSVNVTSDQVMKSSAESTANVITSHAIAMLDKYALDKITEAVFVVNVNVNMDGPEELVNAQPQMMSVCLQALIRKFAPVMELVNVVNVFARPLMTVVSLENTVKSVQPVQDVVLN